jgi:hypothetical protein
MVWSNGADPLNDAIRLRQPDMLERDGPQRGLRRGEQFAWPQQEFGIMGPAKALVSHAEGLVDENAIFRHGGHDLGEDGSPQVIGDDHTIEALAAKRKRAAVLDVHFDEIETTRRCGGEERPGSGDVAIDPRHAQAARQTERKMPTGTARDIQDAPTHGDAVNKPGHPWRGSPSLRPSITHSLALETFV